MSMYTFTIRRDMQRFGLTIPDIGIRLYLMHMPWLFKFIPAIFCDIVPICNRHRKPYIILSLVLATVSVSFLVQPIKEVDIYTLCIVLMNFFVSIADVNYDACIVEDSREEEGKAKGGMQTAMWFFRFVGEATGDTCGPIIWATFGSSGVFTSMAIIIASSLFISLFLADARRSTVIGDSFHPSGKGEDFNVKGESNAVQLKADGTSMGKGAYRSFTLWYGLSLIKRSIMHPIIRYILLYNLITSIFPSPQLPIFFYMTNELHFTPQQMSLMGFLSAIGKLSGTGLFHLFKRYSIQSVYMFISISSIILASFSYIVTVRFSNGETMASTMGMNNFWCIILDDIIGDMLGAVQFMTLLVLASAVCERAVEAGSYSAILSLTNLFNGTRRFIDSSLMQQLRIDNGSFANLSNMVIICMGFRLLSFFMVPLLVPDATIGELSDDLADMREMEAMNAAESINVKTNKHKKKTAMIAAAATRAIETETTADSHVVMI